MINVALIMHTGCCASTQFAYSARRHETLAMAFNEAYQWIAMKTQEAMLPGHIGGRPVVAVISDGDKTFRRYVINAVNGHIHAAVPAEN